MTILLALGLLLVGFVIVVWATLKAIERFTVYSTTITRMDRTLEEVPLCNHYYCTYRRFRAELRHYVSDILEAGYEVEEFSADLINPPHSQIMQSHVFEHPKTGSRLTITVTIIRGFREFRDQTRRKITAGKSIPEHVANTIRKEVLANRYPELADKRYYTYIVVEDVWDYGDQEPTIRVSAHRSAQSAMDWIQAQEHEGEEEVVASDYPVHIDYNGDKLWRYRIFRELF